jgi:hypothetical protein
VIADWGVRWPDDPDTVEEHPTEESARRVATVYHCAQLMHRTVGLWLPVTEDTPTPQH